MRAFILFILFLLGAGIFILFYAVPWIGEKAANLVPVEAEVALGESLSKVYAEESQSSDSANYYLHKFVERLDLDDTYDIDARIILSEDINAFALPGGKIFIYSGILEKMQTYKELVALLGHEVTHVTNRHSLKSICRSAATGIAISSIFGDLNGITSGIISKADEFKQLDYSRELETEADNAGIKIMLKNKVDPKGMLDLLNVLKKGEVETPRYMKYLSTHPDTESRILNISENSGPKKSFPPNEKLRDLFIKLKESL